MWELKHLTWNLEENGSGVWQRVNKQSNVTTYPQADNDERYVTIIYLQIHKIKDIFWLIDLMCIHVILWCTFLVIIQFIDIIFKGVGVHQFYLKCKRLSLHCLLTCMTSWPLSCQKENNNLSIDFKNLV